SHVGSAVQKICSDGFWLGFRRTGMPALHALFVLRFLIEEPGRAICYARWRDNLSRLRTLSPLTRRIRWGRRQRRNARRRNGGRVVGRWRRKMILLRALFEDRRKQHSECATEKENYRRQGCEEDEDILQATGSESRHHPEDGDYERAE